MMDLIEGKVGVRSPYCKQRPFKKLNNEHNYHILNLQIPTMLLFGFAVYHPASSTI